MENSKRHGYPLAPMAKYKSTNKAESLMMLRALNGAIVRCKDLYKAIANKRNPFIHNGGEGHALTHMCRKYARHANMKCPHGTPFSVAVGNS
jgi:hypothetical protein